MQRISVFSQFKKYLYSYFFYEAHSAFLFFIQLFLFV